MKSFIIGVGIGAVTLLSASAALAEPFASHGMVAVGAERVFGVEYTSTTTRAPGSPVENNTSTTSISLLGHLAGLESISSIGSIPRLNLDVFLGPGVSVGGGLMYQHLSRSRETAGVAGGDASQSYYLFAPRVGFGLPITDKVAIWPRLGLSYLYITGETENTIGGVVTKNESTDGLWFTTLDALLLYSPVEHVAFNVGPALDILIGGPTTTENGVGTPSPDTSMYSLGLHAGMTVLF